MIWADLGRAVLLGSIPVAAVLGVMGLPQLIVVAFAAAILSTFFDVADRSYLPTIVSPRRLVAANSALTASASVAEFTSFGIGGFLIKIFSAPIAILIDAVSFVVSASPAGDDPPEGAAANARRRSRAGAARDSRRDADRRPLARYCAPWPWPTAAPTSCGASSGRRTCSSRPTTSTSIRRRSA